MVKKIIDLNTFANGAVSERFNEELLKILQNIADPNTDPKKSRKLTLTVKLAGDDQRNLAAAVVEAKATLAPAKEIQTKIIMDYDNDGVLTGAELKSSTPGQTYMDEDGVYSDTGEKVYDFKKKKELV